jgi:hypothetical protein
MTTYAADKFTLKTVQGDDWEYPVTFSTSLAGIKTPIDLTGVTYIAEIRPTYSSGTVTVMSATPVDLVNGKVTFSLTDTQTSALPSGSLVYQISITISGSTKTYLQGSFIVKPKV